jgi:hypothetical protein
MIYGPDAKPIPGAVAAPSQSSLMSAINSPPRSFAFVRDRIYSKGRLMRFSS